MLNALRPVRSLLSAIAMLMAGAGFMGTLVSLRLQDAGYHPTLIGLVATAYFGGLTIGSLRAPKVIGRVGHIRAFAAFVSLLSATTLAYSAHQNIVLWGVLRFVDGVCLAGVYVCLESWLNDRAEPHTRGTVLAVYMIALYGGQAVGQFLLNVGLTRPSMPFVAGSILISLAVLPITLTRTASPVIASAPALPIRRLYAISPLGFAGAVVTGLVLGSFYGLGAVYARRLGMNVAATAAFMSAVITGGVVLQWPLGWLSDHFDRRRVIIGAMVGATAVSALIAVFAANAGAWLLGAAGIFGGLSFALYPLCVAHTNDHVSPEERVGASGGLVLVYSAGAAAGPALCSLAMALFGTVGLFGFVAACMALAAAFGIWRLTARSPVPSELQHPYQALPRTTPMSATLDPIASDSP
jgi:MFS family permease